jgi:hypothetical protein
VQADWPSYGIVEYGGNGNAGCALTVNDSAFLNCDVGVALYPGTNAFVYLKMANTWLDTDGSASAIIAPQAATGTIGSAEFNNVHFAPVGGVGLSIDNTNAGAIRLVEVSNSNFQNYTAGTNSGILIQHAITNAIFMGNTIGINGSFQNAFTANLGANNFTLIGNALLGTSAGFFCGGAGANYWVEFNRWVGGAAVNDTCSGANRNVANNF